MLPRYYDTLCQRENGHEWMWSTSLIDVLHVVEEVVEKFSPDHERQADLQKKVGRRVLERFTDVFRMWSTNCNRLVAGYGIDTHTLATVENKNRTTEVENIGITDLQRVILRNLVEKTVGD